MFLVNTLFFLFISFVFFLNPGLLILRLSKIKRIGLEEILISFVFGLCFYNLSSLLFHNLGVPHILLAFVIIANIILLKQGPLVTKIPTANKKTYILFAILILGIIGQLLVISPSGIKNKQGDMIFYSSNGHDGAWHIAIMNEVQKKFPLQNPSYAGEKLTNYHFLSDIAPSDINLFFKLNKTDLYFKFFPLLYSILLGLLAYFLGKIISKSVNGGLWSVFFTYFAGSFGYIVTLIREGKISGESLFWSSQIQSVSGNPPQAFALTIILAILISIQKYEKDKKIIWLLMLTAMASSLSLIKIYAFIVLVLSLGFLSLYQIIKRKNYRYLIATIIIGVLSFSIYFLSTSNPMESKSFLIFEPWWYIRTMVVEPSRLNLLDWELRRQTYLYERNFLRVIQIEFQSFIIFLIGNLGTRIIAIYWLIKERKKIFLNQLYINLIIIILISLTFPLFFIQKGVAGNTIQTFQYVLLITGILAGVSTAKIMEKIKINILKIFLAILIIVVSMPTQVALIYEFYSKPPIAKISRGEIEALNFLKEKTSKDSIILTPLYNQYSKFKNQSTPKIWAWFDSSYIAAFSERKNFFSDFEQMDIMGYDINKRRKIVQEILMSPNIDLFKNLLIENKIDYLYIPRELKDEIKLYPEVLKKVFENSEVEIWQFKN